jgi:aflatoxin B1 aldehyde reductase
MNSSYKKTPKVILGTWNFGNQVDEMTADRMVGMFLDKGYNELDTAYSYCDGVTEEILGRILSPLRREKAYLATKVNPWNEDGLGYQQLGKQVELSLKRLKASYVDLLYLHAPDPKTQIEVPLETSHRLFQQGKIREAGTFPCDQSIRNKVLCLQSTGWWSTHRQVH